jgi:hypothetical protein
MRVNKVFLIPVCIFMLLCFMLLGFIDMSTQHAQANRASSATIVTHFNPVGIRNAPTLPGDCWETSLAAPRVDAWRCIVANTIYDPCFSSPSYQNYVICNTAPTGDMLGIKVELTRPLPASTASPTAHQPWTLRLSNGVVCSFLTGATYLIDNQRVNYGCTDGVVIPGMPTQGTTWTVREKLPNQNNLVTMQVAEVWI